MKQDYFFVNADLKIDSRPASLIHAIGKEQFEKWKRIKLFHVYNAFAAADFVIHAVSKTVFTNRVSVNEEFNVIEKIVHDHKLTSYFMGAIYCNNRGLIMDIVQGNYCVQVGNVYDTNKITGIGSTPLMALVDLARELEIEEVKSFIP